jgi:hypothetical protein
VDEDSSGRNYRGIGISLLVICIVLALIVLAVIIQQPEHHDDTNTTYYSFDDIFDSNFEPKRFNGIWINGTFKSKIERTF